MLLPGCTQSSIDGLQAFDRAQIAQDELPQVVVDAYAEAENSGGLDLSTSRFVGSVKKVDYYVSMDADRSGYCLFIFQSAQSWGGACSDGAGLTTELGDVAEARLSPGGILPNDDQTWVRLEDVIVRPI